MSEQNESKSTAIALTVEQRRRRATAEMRERAKASVGKAFEQAKAKAGTQSKTSGVFTTVQRLAGAALRPFPTRQAIRRARLGSEVAKGQLDAMFAELAIQATEHGCMQLRGAPCRECAALILSKQAEKVQ